MHEYYILKSQITSTKSQINYKFQYSMTKTALIGSFFDILSMFGILNFGHYDLPAPLNKS